MPRFFIGISAVTLGPWLVLVGCGESSGSNDGGAGGGTSQAAGADAAGASAGKASGGNATAGSNTSSGAAGGDATGAGSAGDSGSGSAGAPETGGEGGGASGGLVSCDPEQASCRVPPGTCPAMQVREVVGACWGNCVKVEQCACSAAAQCPDANQYTCWMGRHCGPYVN